MLLLEGCMSLVRLLSSVCLLSLCSVALSQDRPRTPLVPSSCPMTIAADHPFVPPPSYPVRPSIGQFWFGTDRLWTALPVSGTWKLGHYEPDDPTFRQKLMFWRQGYDSHADRQPNLTVSGRRLDSPAAPLQTDGKGVGSWTKDSSFIMTGINFPTAGCWEIKGRFDNDELTFVIWVAP